MDNYILLINLFLLYSSAQYLDTRTSHEGDDQFVAANRERPRFSENMVRFT